jgi:hypothetical protein
VNEDADREDSGGCPLCAPQEDLRPEAQG